MLFCAGTDNGLYVKVEPFVLPWQRIGHANNVTAMAQSGGRLFCSTADNVLWVRNTQLSDVNWSRIGHANNVVAMTAQNGNLVCATADRTIWVRPAVDADVPWTPIGQAPEPVRGIGFLSSTKEFWVSTNTDRLYTFTG